MSPESPLDWINSVVERLSPDDIGDDSRTSGDVSVTSIFEPILWL